MKQGEKVAVDATIFNRIVACLDDSHRVMKEVAEGLEEVKRDLDELGQRLPRAYR